MKLERYAYASLLLAFAAATPLSAKAADLPVIEAQLGTPPTVAPPTERNHPARVVVRLEVRELVKEIADGVQYTFWTFGGSVPGPMIRVRRGDTVELHLMNHPDNAMAHSIDLHAVTGPGGGAASTFTAPGRESRFTFEALNEGVYMYHCAAQPVGMHVANGMYGMIVVEPEAGYPPVDREYYVVQGDFYTRGGFKEAGLQPFDMEKAIEERPSYVLFNGREGSLVGDRALPARVGETVRMFIGNGGPNLVSSFHVIGEIFDTVRAEGGRELTRDVQTTLIPAGGSAVVEFALQVPGTMILVDHSLFRAFNKGALGMLKVEGSENKRIYSGREADDPYLPALSGKDNEPQAAPAAPQGDTQAARGVAVYGATCAACHQQAGQGLGSVFPPLAKSDFLMADKERSIRIVLNGLSGPIVVNGAKYDNVMPPFAHLTDAAIADVLTFVRSDLGNRGEPVREEEVARIRASLLAKQVSEHP